MQANDGEPADAGRSDRDGLELAHRARAGDREALGELLRRHQARLRRIVRIRLGGGLRRQIESMDVVQDTFLVASRKIEDFEPRDEASVLAWLSTIALNQIRDANDRMTAQKRDVRREVQREVSDPAESGSSSTNDPAADDTLPLDRIARAELVEIVDAAVGELPEHYREAILLRDYHGGSWSWVAERLGAPSDDAAMKIYHRAWTRARSRVRSRLGEAE